MMLYLIRYIPAVFSPIHFVDGLDNRRINFCIDNIKQENYTSFNRNVISGTTCIKAVDENREKSIGLLCAL